MTRLEWMRRAGRALCDMGIEDGMQEALHALSCFYPAEFPRCISGETAKSPEEIAGRMEDMIRRRGTENLWRISWENGISWACVFPSARTC